MSLDVELYEQELVECSNSFIEEFGDEVTYYPAGGDTGRTIKALIKRLPLENIISSMHGISTALKVFVKNDGATGIASNELDVGTDELSLPVNFGATNKKRRITGIIKHNAGFIILEVR